MNRILIVIILATFTTAITAQKSNYRHRNGNDCENFPELVDSLYVFDWSNSASEWVPVSIWQYENSDGKHDRLLFIRADSRLPIRARDYFYDIYGNRDLEIGTAWRNNEFINTQKKETEFSADNKVLNQLVSLWRNEKWLVSTYSFNEYSDNKLLKMTYQIMNTDSVLYDHSYSMYSYENEQVSKVMGYKASNDSIVAMDQYFYNDNKSLSESLTMVPNPDIQNNISFIPSKRRLYYYDDFSLLREVMFQNWNGSAWDTISKYVYFYKFDNAKKVAVCHNGHMICVSVNAVKSHLAHGDILGECAADNTSERHGCDEKEKQPPPPFTIYPNPAKERITIKFEKDECKDLRRVELTDFYGKLVKSFNIKDNSNLTINRENLHSGKYYIRLIGKEIYSAVVIFE